MVADTLFTPVTGESSTNKNPYIGPRPFRTEERDRFFGRDTEANELILRVIANRLVLLYAESGAGKSSLINARLIPGLAERNFKVLLGRVGGQTNGVAGVDNIYIHNLLLSLEHTATPPAPSKNAELKHMSLHEYLSRLEVEVVRPDEAYPARARTDHAPDDAPEIIGRMQPLSMEIGQAGPAQMIGQIKPLVLIIDQFEEIFTTHPEQWEKREAFFKQLRRAQEEDPYLWVVLSIREDYIARLDPYAPLLYGGEGFARFHLQAMTYQAALEAVKNPVLDSHPFDEGVAEDLVNHLRRLQPSKNKWTEKLPGDQLGQYVWPVQLQVVCYQLWEKLKDKEACTPITKMDLNQLASARGGDLALFISDALADFYEQAIRSVVQAMQSSPDPELHKVTERRLREWFMTGLITKEETCNLILREQETTGGMPNAAVELLEQQFIIRAEVRSAGTWYELSHDRFIAPILQSNRTWNVNHPRPILASAEAWANAGKSAEKLYEGHQLAEAQKLLDNPQSDLSELEREFIRASAGQAQTRRSRNLILAFAALLIVLTIMMVNFQHQSEAARQSAQEAQIQRETAVFASEQEAYQRQTAVAANIQESQQRMMAQAAASTAEAASAQESQQRKKAESLAATAEAASALAGQQAVAADQARATAVAASELSQASRLASLSEYFRETKTDVSQLLAVQAFKVSNSLESRRALLNSIQSGMTNRISRVGFPWYTATRPYSMAFSPDGLQMAVSTQDNIYLRNTKNGELEAKLPYGFVAPYPMQAIAFDATGNLLARGGGDGNVVIWDRQANTTQTIRPFAYKFTSILSIAFQPGGTLLAITTEIHPDTEKGQLYIYNYKENTKQPVYTNNCGAFACTKAAWSPDGKRLAFASGSGTLKVIDVNSYKTLLSVPRAHNSEISGLAWYPDGNRLVTSGYDGRLIQWDVDAQKILHEYSLQNKSVPMSLALSPDGRFLLAGNNDAGSWFGLWDAEKLQKLDFNVSGHTRAVTAVAFSPQGSQFATTGFDNTVLLWNLEQVDSLGTQLMNLPGPQIEAVSQDALGRLIFARNIGKAMLEVITDSVSQPARFPAPHSGLAFIRLDGRLVIALGGLDGQVAFIDPATGKPVREPVPTAGGTVRSLAFSADGHLLAAVSCKTSSSCEQLTLRNMQRSQPIALKGDFKSLQPNDITSLAFSPDAKILAIGTTKGTITLYDIESGAIRQVATEGLSLQTKPVAVSSLAFSPAEQGMLIAGFKDGRIALWDAVSLGPVGEFSERMNGEVTGLLLRPSQSSGQWALVSVSGQGEVREWITAPDDWVARACQMAGRNLTQEEKKKFLFAGSSQEDICPAVKK